MAGSSRAGCGEVSEKGLEGGLDARPGAPQHPESNPKGAVDPVTRSRLLGRVSEFYAAALHRGGAGLECLKAWRLDDSAMIDSFGIGYCDGSMRDALPRSGEIVEQLKAVGVLDARGSEVFRGRVTVPIRDAAGNVVDVCGRAVTGERRKDMHLCGPHRGVFNAVAAKTHRSLIVTGGVFDALSLWAAGWRNAISLQGGQSWTEAHEALVREHGTRDLILALDGDARGRGSAEAIEAKVGALVQSLHRVNWPEGVRGVRDFFSSRNAEGFRALLPGASAPAVGLEGDGAGAGDTIPTADGFAFVIGGRRYELCAIQRPGASRLKATVRAVAARSGRFHIDTVDFYLSRSRRIFVSEAALLFEQEPGIIEADVNRLIVATETHLLRSISGQGPAPAEMPETDRTEALRMGRNPDLVGEIQRDLARLGIIGEETNRLLIYVAMTSRKAEEPLAVQILSSSGAGKSHLQDAVLSLCPEEDLIKLTSLSGQALFYKGRESLQHKCLAIAEAAGAEEARYALRNLISEKKLVVESTVKNPLTGRLETQLNTVQGPTAVFETTTRPDADAETRSRYVLLSLDESEAQTRAILEAQRHGHTLEGRRRRRARQTLVAKHRAFQRLLEPVAVVNPFEPLLCYGDDRLAFRRDHPKYLNLILAVSFLHQMGRRRMHDPELGDYVEATLGDIAIANGLAHELFGQSMDDLSVPSREALERIGSHVERRARELGTPAERVEFSRRELREAFGWSDTRLRVYLRELVEMEYLAPTCGRSGLRYRYRLVDAGTPGPRRVPGLKDVESLRREARLAGVRIHPAGTSPQPSGGMPEPPKPLASREIADRAADPAADGEAYPVKDQAEP